MDHARRFGDRLTKQEQALLDLAAATDNNDGAAALEAAQRTGVPILIASQALLVRRPRTAVAALASTDSDRGMNIPLAAAYWSRLSQAYAQLGDYDRDSLGGGEPGAFSRIDYRPIDCVQCVDG